MIDKFTTRLISLTFEDYCKKTGVNVKFILDTNFIIIRNCYWNIFIAKYSGEYPLFSVPVVPV